MAVNGVLINNYRHLLHQPGMPSPFAYYLLHLLTGIYRRRSSRRHLRRQKTSLYLDSLRLSFTALHDLIYQVCKYRLPTASADGDTQKKITWPASSQTENQPWIFLEVVSTHGPWQLVSMTNESCNLNKESNDIIQGWSFRSMIYFYCRCLSFLRAEVNPKRHQFYSSPFHLWKFDVHNYQYSREFHVPLQRPCHPHSVRKTSRWLCKCSFVLLCYLHGLERSPVPQVRIPTCMMTNSLYVPRFQGPEFPLTYALWGSWKAPGRRCGRFPKLSCIVHLADIRRVRIGSLPTV